jgi:hypothetical protein
VSAQSTFSPLVPALEQSYSGSKCFSAPDFSKSPSLSCSPSTLCLVLFLHSYLGLFLRPSRANRMLLPIATLGRSVGDVVTMQVRLTFLSRTEKTSEPFPSHLLLTPSRFFRTLFRSPTSRGPRTALATSVLTSPWSMLRRTLPTPPTPARTSRRAVSSCPSRSWSTCISY